MSDKRLEFIEKYEKSYETALKMEKVMIKYFDQNYGEYLYDINVSKSTTFMASGIGKSMKKLNFIFCFEESVEYHKLSDIKSQIWQSFNDMFNFDLVMWGCPIEAKFYQLQRQKV